MLTSILITKERGVEIAIVTGSQINMPAMGRIFTDGSKRNGRITKVVIRHNLLLKFTV